MNNTLLLSYFHQNNTNLVDLNMSWSDVTLGAPCVAAVEQLLLSNCTLGSLPLDRLLVAAPPDLRSRLSDATKVNIGLRASSSPLLLPWPVRKAFRLYAGHPVPDDAVNPDNSDPVDDAKTSDLVLGAGRLSPFDTWVEIGRGAFGCVYRAALDGRPACVKVITRGAAADDDDDDDDRNDDRGMGFFREVALMHELGAESHARRRCVYARHVYLPPGSTDTIWLVFDLMENGSLDQAVAQLTAPQRLQVLADVSRAVADLHAADVLHRDLAIRNVLLDSLCRAFLCDFGLSCRGAYAWACAKAPMYDWAPELWVVADTTYTPAADVWSFGILMLATLLGRNPLLALEPAAIMSLYRAWATATTQVVPALDAAAAGDDFRAAAGDDLHAAATKSSAVGYYRQRKHYTATSDQTVASSPHPDFYLPPEADDGTYEPVNQRASGVSMHDPA